MTGQKQENSFLFVHRKCMHKYFKENKNEYESTSKSKNKLKYYEKIILFQTECLNIEHTKNNT